MYSSDIYQVVATPGIRRF